MELNKNKIIFFTLIFYFFIFGTIASFLIPPFQKPDEFAHFKKVVSLANFDWFCQKKQQPLNPNLYQVITNLQISLLPFNYNSKMPVELYKTPPIKGKSILFDIKEGCRFFDNFGYLIPVVVYKLTSFLSLNGFILFGLMRFLIFACSYTVLIYFILKGKNSFIKQISFFILALPMTINQLSAFSYDVGHLFFGLMFINLFFNFLEIKKLSWTSLTCLLVVFFLFIFSKALYESFFLLFFLISRKKLTSIGIKKEMFLLLIFMAIVVLRLSFYEKTGINLGNYDSTIQKEILLENPWRLFSILKKTYFDSFEFYVKSLIGILGWLDFHLDFFVYVFFVAIFGYIIGVNLKSIKITSGEAIIYFLLLISGLLGLFLGEFFYWTSPGASRIEGVQGRYLIIFLPFFSYLLIYLIRNIKYSFILIVFFLLILNLRSIYYRYYDYSVYARPTKDLLISKKRYILIKPRSEKIFTIKEKIIGACYGVYLKFKNKKFNSPVKVEIFDDKNKQVVYFLKEQVNNSQVAIGVSFPKTKFQKPVYIKVVNKYSLKSLIILDEAALNCIQD